MKKSVITLLIAAILLCLTACGGGATPDSASPDSATADQVAESPYHLVSSVKVYQKDAAQGVWIPQNTTTIEYDKTYPVRFTTVNEDDQEHPKITACAYTFDEEYPLTRVDTVNTSSAKTTAEYQNGRLSTVNITSGAKTSSTVYQYGGDDDYYTLALTETRRDESGDDPAVTNEEVDSVIVTTQNGLLKTTSDSGVYANWADGDKKEWQRLRGIYTADYDDDGIISVMTGDFGKDGKRAEKRFVTTRDGGRITEVVEEIPGDDDSWTQLMKYEFAYNDTAITPMRYSLMMNWVLAGGDNQYYHYHWY